MGFGVVLALQLVTTGIGMSRMSDLSDRMRISADVDDAKLAALADVRAEIGVRDIAARNLVLDQDPNGQAAGIDLVRKSQAAIDAGIARLVALMADPATTTSDQARLLDQLRSLEASYLPIASNVVALATAHKTDQAVRTLTQECMPLLTRVLAHAATFNDLLKKQTQERVDAAQASYVTAKWTAAALTLAALAVGGLIAWRLARSITQPLRQAVDVAQRVAQGDLTVGIDSSRSDEAGKLLAALEQMNDGLVKVVDNVRQASDLVDAVAVFRLANDVSPAPGEVGPASVALDHPTVFAPPRRLMAPGVERRGPNRAKNVIRPEFGAAAPTPAATAKVTPTSGSDTEEWASF